MANLIYFFEKDKNLFSLGEKDAMKNDLYKKYESMRENGVNRQKIKNMALLKTESVLEYISKEFKWDPNLMNSMMET